MAGRCLEIRRQSRLLRRTGCLPRCARVVPYRNANADRRPHVTRCGRTLEPCDVQVSNSLFWLALCCREDWPWSSHSERRFPRMILEHRRCTARPRFLQQNPNCSSAVGPAGSEIASGRFKLVPGHLGRDAPFAAPCERVVLLDANASTQASRHARPDDDFIRSMTTGQVLSPGRHELINKGCRTVNKCRSRADNAEDL